MPIPFILSLILFYLVLAASTVASLLLLFIFAREGHNVLLRSTCLLLLLLNASILGAQLIYGREFDGHPYLCLSQAVLLNYCLVGLQAHGAFMMINNCWVALSWRPHGAFGDLLTAGTRRVSLFLVLAYALPLIPLLLVGYFALVNELHVEHRAFYCVIVRPRLFISTIWFAAFAITGTVFAVYLIYRMIKTRAKVEHLGTASQISWVSIGRLVFSSTIYTIVANLVYTPLLFERPHSVPKLVPEDLLSLLSPWTNKDLCLRRHDNVWLDYFRAIRCPSHVSYAPVVIGITFFLMYGFGTPAFKVYREMRVRTARMLGLQKRKLSAIVYQHSNSVSSLPETTTGMLSVEESAASISMVELRQSIVFTIPTPIIATPPQDPSLIFDGESNNNNHLRLGKGRLSLNEGHEPRVTFAQIERSRRFSHTVFITEEEEEEEEEVSSFRHTNHERLANT